MRSLRTRQSVISESRILLCLFVIDAGRGQAQRERKTGFEPRPSPWQGGVIRRTSSLQSAGMQVRPQIVNLICLNFSPVVDRSTNARAPKGEIKPRALSKKGEPVAGLEHHIAGRS